MLRSVYHNTSLQEYVQYLVNGEPRVILDAAGETLSMDKRIGRGYNKMKFIIDGMRD